MRFCFISILATTALAYATCAAADETAAVDSFAACVAALGERAMSEGLSAAVVNDVLGQVKKVERVIELDRNQPEFIRTFADYYDRRVTEQRVMQGRELRDQHAALLQDLQQQYGVPPHYLLAFWGLESNFGSYFGNIPTVNALSTLACDPRRGEFFAGELIAALRIVETGDIEADQMLGSWAGAMGHVQFLPSVFLKYAVDADQDGRSDLWRSVPDALASAANFLQGIGWTTGLRWGREVHLPDDFDYALAGRANTRALSEWTTMGITNAFGDVLPALDLQSSVLVPAGHEGPAFLVYENFEVIMRWNRSEYYAIAVGRLADRISGAGRLTRPADTAGESFTRDTVVELQANLAMLAYDVGEVDGIFGSSTRRALSAFQKSQDMLADGHLDSEVIKAINRKVGESKNSE